MTRDQIEDATRGMPTSAGPWRTSLKSPHWRTMVLRGSKQYPSPPPAPDQTYVDAIRRAGERAKREHQG